MNSKRVCKISFSLFLLFTYSLSVISAENVNSDSLGYILVSPDQNIQSILNEASEHSTIYFTQGVYNQSFTVKKPLTLLGQDKNSTILRLNTKPNNAGIILSAASIQLLNMTVSNSAQGLYTTAIRINDDGCRINNCRILNTPIGITVWSNHCEIAFTHFQNCSDEGILLISTKISQSYYNKIHNCSFSNNCDAIELQYSSHNQISDCFFSGNTHSAIDAICEKNNHNIISNCQINYNEVHGIYFSSSQHNLIKNCSFLNNGEENILFTHNSYNNLIINSTIPQKTLESLPTYNATSNVSIEKDIDEILPEKKIIRNQTFFDRVETMVKSFLEKIRSMRELLDS
jgi:parallel beta-helix repeat protein